MGNKGVALLMAMSMMVVLTVILATFTYDTQLNVMRMSNIQEKMQARLNAEGGLNFAMAQLRLYQAANNRISRYPNLQSFANPSRLEAAVTSVSLIYPAEMGALVTGDGEGEEEEDEDEDEQDLIQKVAKENFEENNLLRGGVNVSIKPIKGFLNPNRLVAPLEEEKKRKPKDPKEEEKKPPSLIVEEEMIKALSYLLEQEKESNPDFAEEYGDIEAEFLVKELAWYVNRPEKFNDPDRIRIEEMYAKEGVTPKHSPLISLEELYLLQGWPEAIVNLVKDSLTVHENHSIPINEIVQSQLEALFPELNEEEVQRFFEYRDGDSSQELDPNPFNNVSHFKNFLIRELNISEEAYKRRAEELERAKMKFGVVGKLYKVTSRGQYNRANYTLTAFIEIPVEPPKKEPSLPPRSSRKPPPKKKKREKKEKPEVLLPPKIVEIRIQ